MLKDNPPDLILSGVNHGSNLAEDVTYSGTIAGAMEGTMLGIRSIAMSLTIGFDPEGRQHWKTPLEHGPELVQKLLATPWPTSVLMNVNYPDLPPEKVAGIVATNQGRRDQGGLHIDERSDTWGDPYFWVGFERRRSDPPAGYRSARHCRRHDLGHAALARSHRRADARGHRRGAGSLGPRPFRGHGLTARTRFPQVAVLTKFLPDRSTITSY